MRRFHPLLLCLAVLQLSACAQPQALRPMVLHRGDVLHLQIANFAWQPGIGKAQGSCWKLQSRDSDWPIVQVQMTVLQNGVALSGGKILFEGRTFNLDAQPFVGELSASLSRQMERLHGEGEWVPALDVLLENHAGQQRHQLVPLVITLEKREQETPS